MSLFRQGSRRVDLVSADAAATLPQVGALTVVLSAHLVRYAVLPWSSALRRESEWSAYAHHAFTSVHGAHAAHWSIRMCSAGRRKSRVACAVDTSLLNSLLQQKHVVSIQPRLMAEFNARRALFGRSPAWLVVPDAGRLTLGLIADEEWKSIRTRQVGEDWRSALPDLIARESALAGEPACERIVVAEVQ